MIYLIIEIIFAVILLALAMSAVHQRDVVRSIIYLMIFLFVLGADFIFIGATLLGSIELLVYVGAVSSLLVFTMMLTGGKEIE